tara:strand:+ start:1539 stop:1898 length:360 start_codon:yes stop_codon:yes gene_type:complete
MDNSQMVFCKVEDIDIMNQSSCVEENDMTMIESIEYCEYCLGSGSVLIDDEEYECEYCDIFDSLYGDSDTDTDSDYDPNWSSDCDTDNDTFSEGSDMEVILIEECGKTCNQFICYCGSV